MKALRTKYPQAVVLTLRGDFDAYIARPFLAELDRLLEEDRPRVVLNMRHVRFLSSTAVGALIRARKAARSQGGDLALSQPSKAVLDTLAALGLDGLFAIHLDDVEALDALPRLLPVAS